MSTGAPTRGYKEPHELPRRFYKAATAVPAEGGFAVHLDGRPPRTPGGKPLVLPTRPLAAMIAAEWEGQGEHIRMAQMPATRLANTVLDKVGDKHAETAAEVARYANSDLVCYFAEEPAALVARQETHWGPVLDWAHANLGLTLQRVGGVIHRDQSPDQLARARQMAEALDDFQLAGLAHATALFGSAVLGFALQRGELTGARAFELSRLDEAFQEERWGVDAEAAERTARLAQEAQMLDGWFAALR